MKKTSSEVENKVIELYLNGEKLEDIEKITGSKSIKHILKRNNIQRKRDPKEYNNKKEERNRNLIVEYLDGNISISQLSDKYDMTNVNIYRILKSYNIVDKRKANQHWVINKKLKETPNLKCKFYILNNYYGYTKLGITTKNEVKYRFGKNVNVFYEIDNTLEYCHHIEVKLKKILKSHIPPDIDKSIDGWSECYNLSPETVYEYVKSTVRETSPV